MQGRRACAKRHSSNKYIPIKAVTVQGSTSTPSLNKNLQGTEVQFMFKGNSEKSGWEDDLLHLEILPKFTFSGAENSMACK